MMENILLLASADSGYLYGLFFIITALIIGAAIRHLMAKFSIPLPFTVILMLIGVLGGYMNYKSHHGENSTSQDYSHNSQTHEESSDFQANGLIVDDNHFNNALVKSHRAGKNKRGEIELRSNRDLTFAIGKKLESIGKLERVLDNDFKEQFEGLKSGYYAPLESTGNESNPNKKHESHDDHSHDSHNTGFFAKLSDTVSGAIEWGANLDPHLILYVFLPILIFEAAFAMDVHTFKKSFANAFFLAGPGIVTATVLTGTCVWALVYYGMPGLEAWSSWEINGDKNTLIYLCMLFGAIASATDPVAVVALLKELGASKKLGTLIEGESLLNDGTAIVVFVVLFGVVTGATTFDVFDSAMGFLKIGLAGAIVGLLIAFVTIIWVKRVFNDPLVEISIIVSSAYATFYVAEYFMHVSGVLALVALGVAMASIGRTRISPEVEHFLHEFWEIAAFIANVIIFVIVGVIIGQRTLPHVTLNDVLILLAVYVIIHLVRMLNIIFFYPWMRKAGYGLPIKDAYVVWWGALRGAIGLALALVVAGSTLHDGSANPIPVAIREQFLFHISGIVFLTLLVNASTVKVLVNKLGLTEVPAVKKLMMHQAFAAIQSSGASEIELMKSDRFVGGANWSRVRGYLPKDKIGTISERELAKVDALAETRRRILEKERSSYWKQFKEGLLGAQAVNKLSNNVAELLDFDGSVPLTRRTYLDDLCGRPGLLEELVKIPVLKWFLLKNLEYKLASSLDIAKGFIIAQEEVLKLVDRLTNNLEAGEQDGTEIADKLRKEVMDNRLKGLLLLQQLHELYPKVTVGIETKQAIRTILNHERSEIKKLQGSGAIEGDEAAKLIADVEQRIENVMNRPLELRMPTAVEVLKEAPWVKGLSPQIINKIVSASEQREYASGDIIMEQGEDGDGMVLITQGSADVLIGNDLIVDIVGRGAMIGEMAVLAGVKRTASVVAKHNTTALWLSSNSMQSIMEESPELATSLWLLAGKRFAENILSKEANMADFSQIEMRRWLSSGNVVAPEDGQTVNLYDKIVILIAGSAKGSNSAEEISAPALLSLPEAQFSNDARVFFCSHPK